MRFSRIVVLTSIALLFTVAGLAWAGSSLVMTGKNASDFVLRGVSGSERSLSDFNGKYVVLEWVNLECSTVDQYYASKKIPRLQQAMRDQGVIWLSICSSSPGSRGDYEKFDLMYRLAELKSNATDYLCDRSGRVAKKYGVTVTPTIVLLSPQRSVLYAGEISNCFTLGNDKNREGNLLARIIECDQSGKPFEIVDANPKGCPIQ